jgi:cell division protein FtsB
MSEVSTSINKPISSGFSFISCNKDMIRIAVEVIVFIGICYYFNAKNTKTLKHIEDLSQRIEEQEDENEKMRNTVHEMNGSIELLKQTIIDNEKRTETFSLLTKHAQTPRVEKPRIQKVKTEPIKHTPLVSKPIKSKIETIEEEEDDEVIDGVEILDDDEVVENLDDELTTELSELFK